MFCSFHVEGIDKDAGIYIDDVQLIETNHKPWNKTVHNNAWNYPQKPRNFQPMPKSLTIIPKNDQF